MDREKRDGCEAQGCQSERAEDGGPCSAQQQRVVGQPGGNEEHGARQDPAYLPAEVEAAVQPFAEQDLLGR